MYTNTECGVTEQALGAADIKFGTAMVKLINKGLAHTFLEILIRFCEFET